MRKEIFFILFLIGSILGPQGLFSDSGLGRVYFNHGERLFRSGDREDALRLVEISLQFRSDSSDAWLLKSMLLSPGKEGRNRALAAAEKAVDVGVWEFYSADEGILRLSSLLTETRRYGEALAVLERDGPPGILSPELSLLRIRCLAALELRPRLKRELDSALAAFPGNPGLLEAAFLYKDPLDPDVSALFALMDRTEKKNLPAFAAFIEKAAAPGEIESLADLYYRAGGRDPVVPCALIEKIPSVRTEELGRFIAFGGHLRLELLRRVIRIIDERGLELIEREFTDFTGTLTVDADRDGIPEESFQIASGKIISWTVDAGGDGVDETTVFFSGGRTPSKVVLRNDDESYSYEYSRYPGLAEVEYERGPVRIRHQIVQGALNLPVLRNLPRNDENPIFFEYRPYTENRIPAIEGLKSASRLIEEFSAAGNDLKRFHIRGGEIRIFEAVRGEGDTEIIVRRVFFENGSPASGLRDLDLDGRFDVREEYEDGILSAVTGAGYTESFWAAALKEWDFDGDGKIDAREYRTGKNRVRREYSSLFDGLFDEVTLDTRRTEELR